MTNDRNQKLSEMLWCDLRTDEDRYNWLLLGRGFDTGIIARAIQNDLALAYKRLSQLQSEKSAHARCANTSPTPAVPDGWRIQRVSEHQFEVEHPDTSTVSVSDEGPIRNIILYELCLALAASQAGEPPATHSSWDERYDGWAQMRREAEEQQK